MDSIAPYIGYVALAITLLSFSLASDRWLKVMNLAGCLLWGVHFSMLGEFSASLMMGLASIMVGAAIFDARRLTTAAWGLNILLIPVIGTMAVTSGSGWVAILPVIGGFFINTGVSRCSGYAMTVTIMLGHVLWILAALLMGSLPAVIANSLNFGALVLREMQRRRRADTGAGPGFPIPAQ